METVIQEHGHVIVNAIGDLVLGVGNVLLGLMKIVETVTKEHGHVVANANGGIVKINHVKHVRTRSLVGTAEQSIAMAYADGVRVRMRENVVRGIQRAAATAIVEPEHAVLHVAGDHVWVNQDAIPGVFGALVK